jgi:hypothetical protein
MLNRNEVSELFPFITCFLVAASLLSFTQPQRVIRLQNLNLCIIQPHSQTILLHKKIEADSSTQKC